MAIVADASPLIFLGKIRRLALVKRLFRGPVLVPRAVHDEIVVPGLPPAEEGPLREFLAGCKVVAVRRARSFATALSRADNEVLTLAVRERASTLLADDHLIRQVAKMEGIVAVGTLGILLRAVDKGIIVSDDARVLLDALIREHHFRISIEVYSAVLGKL